MPSTTSCQDLGWTRTTVQGSYVGGRDPGTSAAPPGCERAGGPSVMTPATQQEQGHGVSWKSLRLLLSRAGSEFGIRKFEQEKS